MTTGPTRPGQVAGPSAYAAPGAPPVGRHAGTDDGGRAKPSGAATVLGIGVGLFGTAIGLALVIAGSGLFLDVSPPGDPDFSRRAALGLVLFIVGLIVVVAIVATGLITAAAPIVGGVLATLFGLAGAIGAYVDDLLVRGLDSVGLSDTAQAYVTNWIVTGAALTIGALLLAGGLVMGMIDRRARRSGRRAPAGGDPTPGATGAAPAYAPQPPAPGYRQPAGPPPGGYPGLSGGRPGPSAGPGGHPGRGPGGGPGGPAGPQPGRPMPPSGTTGEFPRPGADAP